jgi:hypothetical protein
LWRLCAKIDSFMREKVIAPNYYCGPVRDCPHRQQKVFFFFFLK